MKALPEIAPIKPHVITHITPREPFIFPTNKLATSRSLSAIPVSEISVPAITNIGTAKSVILIIWLKP